MPTAYVNLTGRLGDILFIYCYARAWCEQNGYQLVMHPWLGEKVFEIPTCPRPGRGRPADHIIPEEVHQRQRSLIYTRQQVRDWIRFKPDVLARLQQLDATRPKLICNRRVADDWRNGGFVCLSRLSYVDAVIRFGYDPADIFWEEDVNQTRLPEFGGDEWGLGYNLAGIGLPGFYRLMTAPVLFRSNSPFTWWAATVGTGKIYAPIVRGLEGGKADVYCGEFVEGNWPTLGTDDHSDLHIRET